MKLRFVFILAGWVQHKNESFLRFERMGATTFSVTTLSIMTLSIMTFGITVNKTWHSA